MAKPAPLKPQHEQFCQLYVKNEELFGNATLCYAEAYHYKLESLSHKETRDDDGNLIEASEYDRAYNVCSVQGHALLRTPKLQDRIYRLLNEMLKDDIVDAQLAKVILQDDKLEPKIAAIREYNKIRQRITEKVDLTSGGERVTGFQMIPPHDRPDQADK
ncbi:MAG TPA: hypothetical protein VGG72_21415 [Bryobacteraceae bacterium]|jgi:hypothetical protein